MGYTMRRFRDYCVRGCDDSFQMLVVASIASSLEEINISGSQWAGGGKVHLEEVLDEMSFEISSDPEICSAFHYTLRLNRVLLFADYLIKQFSFTKIQRFTMLDAV
jgi:hypothetical protein